MDKNRKIGPRKPQFFQVLLPGFNEKLSLPRRFLKHLTNEKLEKATILSPLGKSWHIKVHWNGDSAFFGDGWKEFALAHDLGIGYFLVFRYEGDMVFNVTIFDLSLCEKQYSPMVGDGVIDNGIKREDQSPANNLDSPHSYGQTNAEAMKSPVTRSCVQQASRETNVVEDSEDQEPFETKGLHFKITMTAYCCQDKYILYVPQAFIAATDISTKHQVILRDPEKRLFPVRLVHTTQHKTFFSRGWRDFIVSNNLNPGDVCEFLYPTDSNLENITQVHIFKQSTRRRKEHTPNVEGFVKKKKFKRQSPEPADVVKSTFDFEDQKAPGTTSSCIPRFQVTMTAPYCQDKFIVHVPKAFIRATDISTKHQVILRDPEKRLFPVRLIHTTQRRVHTTQHRTFFSRGWRDFIVSNNLNPGDACEFLYPTDSNLENIMQVHIFKQSTRRRQPAANSDWRKKAKASKPPMQSQTQRITKKHVVHSEVRNSITTTSSCTKRFRLTMTPSSHKQRWIYIPVALKEATSILGMHPVIKDPNGRLFPVRLYHRNKREAYLIAGWREFYVSNNLKAGDICEFQRVADSKEKNMVEVCILRK